MMNLDELKQDAEIAFEELEKIDGTNNILTPICEIIGEYVIEMESRITELEQAQTRIIECKNCKYAGDTFCSILFNKKGMPLLLNICSYCSFAVRKE